MSQQLELDSKNSVDLLKRYADIGYKNSGIASIKEGATLHKHFRDLKTGEGDVKKLYQIIIKTIEVFNTHKVYSLDDAAVIDAVITYVEENILASKESSSKESSSKDSVKSYIKEV